MSQNSIGVILEEDQTVNFNSTVNSGGSIEPREASNNVSQGLASGTVVNEEAPTVNVQNENQNRRRNAPEINTFMNELQAADADTTLSPEGEKYLNDLKKALHDEGFEVMRLVETGMHLIYSKNSSGKHIGIGIFFSECAPRQNKMFMPLTKSLNRYFSDVTKNAPHIPCIDIIMITPYDYPCVKQMASKLVNSIRFSMTDSASLSNMSKFQFRLVTNQNSTLSRIKQLSPHGVLPYMQYAISLEVAKEDQNSLRNNMFRSQEDIEWQSVFTLGGYTEFLYDRGARSDHPPFIPIVTISECAIRYSPVTMLPMIIYAAYDGFIRSGMYLEPFRNMGDRGANIGELVMQNNMSCRINDPAEMEAFINKYVDKPMLAIDLTEGRMNYHGFNMMCNAENNEFLTNLIANSVHPDERNRVLASIPRNMVSERAEMYTGVVNLNGDIVDTRSIDYFSVVNSKNDDQLINRFLELNMRPDSRMQAIYDAGYGASVGSNAGLTSYYSTYKNIIDVVAMQEFFNIAGGLNLIMAGSANYNPALNFSSLRNSAKMLYDNNIISSMNNNFYTSRNMNNYRGASVDAWRNAHSNFFGR